MANYGVCIKSPFDFVIGSLRTFNINYNVSDATNHHAQYYVWAAVNTNFLIAMDQSMGAVPNVAGWPAYYQTPNFHEYWINSNTIQKRKNELSTSILHLSKHVIAILQYLCWQSVYYVLTNSNLTFKVFVF
jgi:hypothetical protein